MRRAAQRWQLGRFVDRYAGLYSEGRAGPAGPRVALLLPMTYMNDSGRSVSAARGALRLEPQQIIVCHDEIDLPFGVVRTKLGGGTAGHRGLKSVRAALGSPDFWRLRIGVGRPDTTDPEVVSRWVLGRFDEPRDAVEALFEQATDALVGLVSQSA